jgi:N-acetylglucosamine-6-sulfatase
MRSGRRFAALALSLSVMVSAGSVDAVTTTASQRTRDPTLAVSGAPNIVLILTDDQTVDELGHMPTVASELIGKGVEFTNAFVSNPLCCPSRASILTGRYSHGTDVYRNQPPHGGFDTFTPEDGSTIATWLHQADPEYWTGLVGKYLNGYESTYEPPGWDVWDAQHVEDSPKGGYYDYDMSIGGTLVHYGTGASDYSTDVLAGYATRFIRSAPSTRPLFLYFAPHAPHGPATPPKRYLKSLPGLPRYRPPNFNEADMSDKPGWAQQLPLLTKDKIGKKVDHFRRKQFRSLLAVDDAVRNILGALSDTGRLNDTLLVFMSDNGLGNGSHRWLTKTVPWEESIRVPLIVRYDPITRDAATVDGHLLLNIDLAPTFAAAAGVDAPGAEGASFLPLLESPDAPWRQDFLIEHLRGLGGQASRVPTYCGVRTTDFKYVEYETEVDGVLQVEEELYDLKADPFELTNLAAQVEWSDVKAALHQRMVTLCNPPPPDFVP